MASDFTLSDNATTDGLDAFAAEIGSLLDGGTLEIRTGSPPAATTDADTGTLLAVFDFADPAFQVPVAGVVTAYPFTATVGIAAGDAGHYRAKDPDGIVIMQGTAGEAADTPDLVFSEKTIAVDDDVAITSFTFEVN